MLHPSPTMNFNNFLAISLNLRIFHHLHVEFCWVLICKKHLPLRKFTLIHATQREPDFVNKFIYASKLHHYSNLLSFLTSTLFPCLGLKSIPKKLLFLSRQSSLSFYNKWLNFCSIDLIILGKMKILDQYTCMLYKTEGTNWNLATNDIFFDS